MTALDQSIVDAARRVYLKKPKTEDFAVVECYLGRRYGYENIPSDHFARSFWVISLHAASVSKSRYRSLNEWCR